MVRKASQYSGAFLLVLVVFACGGGGPGDTNSAAVTKAPLATTNPLAGVDANGNGIRDDVEQFVDRLALADAPRAAALQLARADQAAITTSSGVAAANNNAGEVLRAQTCMASLMPDFTTHLTAIRAETLNTELRRQAWEDLQEKLGRREFPEPQGVICK